MARFAIWTGLPLFVLAILSWWFLFRTESPPVLPGAVSIVAFGDSLTEGFGIPKEESYPAQLERALRKMGYDATVVNEGVSGDTTADGVRRVEQVLAHDADIIILALGANDGLRTLPSSQVKENLRTMIIAIQSSGSIVVLAGMRAPFTAGGEYTRAFNGMYEELAKEYDLFLIPYFLDGVVLREKLNIEDRLHPNTEGYAVILEEHVLPALLEALARLAEVRAVR